MSTMGTFDAFTSARLGIYAAQHGFRVTGNNISNINTVGYTRQRLDQVSFKAGAYDRYRSQMDNHVGSGALVMNINQVRDPTLDVRFRDVNASVGYNDEMLEGLERIASILDEVGVGDDTNVNKKGDGRLHAQIQAVLDALRQFSKDPTKTNNDLVRNAASTMCEIINSYARELETLRVETEQKFNDQITEINECLTNIRNLNEEIRDNEIFGDNALELRDDRNRQIDKLSEYLHISVTYSYEDVGAGKQVEKLTIRLDDSNPDPNVHSDEALLIDGIFGAQISSPDKLPMANPDYDPYGTNTLGNPVQAGDIASFRYLKQKFDGDKRVYLVNGVEQSFGKDDTIPDGATPVQDGFTNKMDEAIQVDNDYYHLQISKLIDQRNRLWEGITTNWEARPGDGTIGTKAQFTVQLDNIAGWADGDTFEVAGKPYTIGKDITLADMQDPEKLAAFLAPKLNASANNTDYTITAQGRNLVYTAKKVGEIGKSGPAAQPTAPEFKPNGTTASVTFGTLSQVQGTGTENVPPADPPAGSTLNPDGSETIISYTIRDGEWWQSTTYKEHTYELTLDDNDTYGSLQAVRELLTEAGEFTTTTVRDTIDENGAKKRGIPYYQNALDLFARQLATEYNKLNQGHMVDQDGNPVTTITGTIEDLKNMGVSLKQASDTVGGFGDGYYVDGNGNFIGEHAPNCNLETAKLNINDTVDEAIDKIRKSGVDPTFANGVTDEADKRALLDTFMKDHGVSSSKTEITLTNDPDGIKMGGLLFSNRNDRDSVGDPNNLEKDPYITAANITISHSWSNGDVQLVPKYDVLWNGEVNNSSQNTNADHMVTMLDKGNIIHFDPTTIIPDAVSDKLFSGSFGEMFNDMCTTLGEDTKKVTVNLNMYYTQSIEIDTARDGVSGVDLNDEAMNLMQFQKAYSAACRLMTVVDEALDRLINNTGVAGR